jgi:hypothetical protein
LDSRNGAWTAYWSCGGCRYCFRRTS